MKQTALLSIFWFHTVKFFRLRVSPLFNLKKLIFNIQHLSYLFLSRLPFHQFWMAVPPLVPAGIAAEPFPLTTQFLFNGAAALLANGSGCRGSKAVPSAEGFHRVDG